MMTEQRTWRGAALEGALVAFAAAAVLEAAGMALGGVPDPSAWLALAVVIAAFFRGPAGGIAAAAFSVLFALLEGRVAGFVFPPDERWLFRMVVVAFALPVLAVLVGFLREQGRRRLSRERGARAEAEEAERRYRELIEGLGAVVWQSDAEGRVQFVTRRAADLFGYPVSEWLDSDEIWKRLIHPDDYDRFVAHRDDAARSGEPWEIDFRVITRAGRVMWLRAFVHVDLHAGACELRGVMVDTSERRRADEVLRRDRERSRQLLEHAADALIVHDEAGRIVDVNASTCRALDYTREELLAMRIEDIEVDFDPERAIAAWRTLAPDAALTQEAVYLQRDGSTFPVDLHVARLHWGGRPLMVSLARDVSQRRRLEERLHAAQRMESVGRLAAGVAHDFNNLLTAIRGHIDLLLAEQPDDAHGRDDLVRASRAADRAAELTRQLLAYSRQQIVSPIVLETDRVVAAAEWPIRRVIGPGIGLEIQLGDAGRVRADPHQLEQVLLDLALNARDAMPSGGRLSITTSTADIAPENVPEPWFRPGRYSVITVTDTGHGMDATTLSHIFEPFFTTRGLASGGGLGLATVYGIVRQAGGHLIPESAPDEGATFRVYLPLSSDAPAPTERPASPRAGSSRGDETVLVVEDEDAVRALVSRVLGKRGYRVIEARDGESALELAGAAAPIHLLITDIVMPRMNGRELAGRLREAHPDIRVLLMSGYIDEEIAEGRELPAGTAFLPKPFTPNALAIRVRETLEDRTIP